MVPQVKSLRIIGTKQIHSAYPSFFLHENEKKQNRELFHQKKNVRECGAGRGLAGQRGRRLRASGQPGTC